MNLIDAVKSGKPFKRKNEDTLYVVKDGMVCFADEDIEGVNPFCATLVSSITAEDWQIHQEPSVTVTATQFWEAAKTAIEKQMAKKQVVWEGSSESLRISLQQDCLGDLAKALGLEP